VLQHVVDNVSERMAKVEVRSRTVVAAAAMAAWRLWELFIALGAPVTAITALRTGG